ncbi:MAG: MarR family transcriptional regulator [Sedimentibacter sp.]
MIKNVGRLISILHRQSQIYINCALKEFNITSAEYAFLLHLYRQDGATQDELTSYLYIDKSAAARAVKSLEQKGFVTRSKDDEDKRFNRVYLTPKATSIKDEVRQRVWHWSDIITEDMDEKDKDTVYEALENMVAKIECKNLKKEMEK